MANRFVIRDRSSGAYCISSNRSVFVSDLQSAVLFASRKNAEKAVKGMFETLDGPERQQYNEWWLDEQRCHPDLEMYIKQYLGWCGCTEDDIRKDLVQRICDPEVVEIQLTLV